MSVMRWSMLFAGVLLVAQNVCAEDSDGGIECNPDGAQIEMNACARDDYEAADAALNAVWKELTGLLEGQDAVLRETRAAQRAWIKFRDAEVEAHFPLDEGEDPRMLYGSMYPMSYNGLLTTLTQQRTGQLRARIEELGAP